MLGRSIRASYPVVIMLALQKLCVWVLEPLVMSMLFPWPTATDQACIADANTTLHGRRADAGAAVLGLVIYWGACTLLVFVELFASDRAIRACIPRQVWSVGGSFVVGWFTSTIGMLIHALHIAAAHAESCAILQMQSIATLVFTGVWCVLSACDAVVVCVCGCRITDVNAHKDKTDMTV